MGVVIVAPLLTWLKDRLIQGIHVYLFPNSLYPGAARVGVAAQVGGASE